MFGKLLHLISESEVKLTLIFRVGFFNWLTVDENLVVFDRNAISAYSNEPFNVIHASGMSRVFGGSEDYQ